MRALRWIITLAYAGFIFYLSSETWGSSLPSFPSADKIIHMLIYAPLSFSLVWALRATAMRKHHGIPIVAFLLAVLYGISDEFHQAFVPGRGASFVDLLADAVGSILGVAAAWWSVLQLRKERMSWCLKNGGMR